MERSAWSAAFIAREGVGGERKSPAHVCVWGGGRHHLHTPPPPMHVESRLHTPRSLRTTRSLQASLFLHAGHRLHTPPC